MPERLALPEPQWVGGVEINSNNLFAYLMMPDNSFFRGKVRFAPELDLVEIEPCLRELHATQELGYVFPPEARDAFEDNDRSLIRHPTIREIERQRREAWRGLFSVQRPVERYRSIYYDSNNDTVYASAISHGKFTEGSVDTFDLVRGEYDPLFEIHTHPFNSLFSDADYQRLIMNATRSGRLRLVKGAIVVCPDIQVMALVAPETLFLLPEQVDEFRARYDTEQSEIGRQIKEINQQLVEHIIDRPFYTRKKMVIESDKRILEEEKYYLRGLYTKEEYRVVMDSVCQKALSDMRAFDEDYGQTIGKELAELKSKRSRLYLLNELEIAREVRPELYMATDFRHFRRFTA